MVAKTLINKTDLNEMLAHIAARVEGVTRPFESVATAKAELEEVVGFVRDSDDREEAENEALVLAVTALRFIFEVTRNDEIDDDDFVPVDNESEDESDESEE